MKNGITDPTELAMFMAQMSHESGSFRYAEEIHDGSDYEGSSILGNNQPGDGPRFKGRGYIQLTGRWNYGHYGKMIGVDLVNNPQLTLTLISLLACISILHGSSRQRCREG